MKPHPEATRDRGEITFNKELSSARVSIECAFGSLKSRWRILQKRLDSRITFSVKISIACAVLHNFCIKIGDEWEDDFYDDDDDLYDDDVVFTTRNQFKLYSFVSIILFDRFVTCLLIMAVSQ